MTTADETFWKARCDDAIRKAYCERTYGVTPLPPAAKSDLREFRFSVDHFRLEAANLVRLLQHAEDAECECGPVLRAHVHDLRHMQAELAVLVSEAEAA